MKTFLKIVLPLVVATALIIGLITLNNKNSNVQVEQPIDQPIVVQEIKPEVIPQNQPLCFSRIENKDVTTATITVNGDKVTGTMDWFPYGVDGAHGTLSGTLENGEMNLSYDYTIEGAHQTEEKIMKIENGNLLIKHGQLEDPKYNGHLIYKDKASAVYKETLEPCVK
jgi:hypothetical protein